VQADIPRAAEWYVIKNVGLEEGEGGQIGRPFFVPFDCHDEQPLFAAEDLGERLQASRSLRRNSRALGSRLCQIVVGAL